MEEDTTNEEPFQILIKTLSELQDATGQQTSFADKFPRFTVHGNQGVGKSSVLEQIVGEPFLPRGGNIVTRFVQDIATQHQWHHHPHPQTNIDRTPWTTKVPKRRYV